VLHTFTGVPDGAGPESGLVLDVQGNLYGTTSIGGTQNLGTVFKVNATGQNTVLHSFTGTPDGEIPIDFGSLAMDAHGDLYGTTNSGGATNNGTVFEVNSSGVETVLWSVPNARAGLSPLAGLLLDPQGNLYGTTELGGHLRACEKYIGCGTVFRVSQIHGKIKETKLYTFTGKADSGNSYAGLVEDAQGNLYGTTTYASGEQGGGTVFKLGIVDGKWKETVLYSFPVGEYSSPYGGLLLDAQREPVWHYERVGRLRLGSSVQA
jgi:uncharacterized repeat protein (TIGR03803 family)